MTSKKTFGGSSSSTRSQGSCEADPARLEEKGLPHEPRVRFSGMAMMSLAEPRRRHDGLIRVIFGVALGAVGRLAEQAAGAIEDGDIVHDGS